jgi:uncharacterized delta-60 repeat protein
MTRSQVRTFVCGIAALAIVCATPAAASAAPGEPDPTFGLLFNGTVMLADRGPADFVVKVLRQSDGKIVTVSSALDANGTSSLVVSRFLPNGQIDGTFTGGGRFIRAFPTGGFVTSAALQPDGKIVLVGSSNNPPDFFVMRLRADGSLDPSFALPHLSTNFGGTRVDEAFAVAIAPGGKIVVAGRSDDNLALARYTSGGALDTTFSGNGLTSHDFGGQSEAEAVVVLADQRIVVSGREATASGAPRLVLARFAANGTLDTTFGTAGRVNPASTAIGSTTALHKQGTKLVIAGRIDVATSGIARYSANGVIDATFGSAGTRRVTVGKFTFVRDLMIDGSGRLVAVGQGANLDDFPDARTFVSIFRFSANGAVDSTFGCSGRVLTEVLGNAGVNYDASGAASAVADGNDILLGGFALTFNGTDFPPADALLARFEGDLPHTSGYGLLRDDGGTSAFGGAPACGSVVGLSLNQPIVGMAYDPAAPGSWSVARDGGIFSFGAARFLGSMGGTRLNQPIVGMAAAPDGNGYWLVARDGGIFSFGSAHFFGSMGGVHLNQPIVGMAAAKDGKGYWLVASDGGIFAFGSARFSGSTGAIHLNQPIVGMAADPDGVGYWLVARDGGVFAFAARFSGSTGGYAPDPIVGIAADPDGTGYWIGARNGGIFSYDAHFAGSTGSTPFLPAGAPRSTIGIAASP